MAIKGKRKPKPRSGRGVTPGPRPAYVPPKTPLAQRTGAKFTVALIIEGILFLTLVGFGEESQTDQQQRRISEFTTLVETALSGAAESIQPFPGGAQVLPQLQVRLTELEGEEPPDEEAIIEETETWSASLNRAAGNIQDIEVPSERLDSEQRVALANAKANLERALRLYAGLAEQLGVAVRVEGEERGRLVDTIRNQLPAIQETFDSGYRSLQEARRLAGLPASSGLSPAGVPMPGLPGGIPGLPGGIPMPPGSIPGDTVPIEDLPVEEPPDEGGGGGGGQNQGGGAQTEEEEAG